MTEENGRGGCAAGSLRIAEDRESMRGILRRIEVILIGIARQMDVELLEAESQADLVRRSRRKGHPWNPSGSPENKPGEAMDPDAIVEP